jgi:arylsulfatase A-like enzyme
LTSNPGSPDGSRTRREWNGWIGSTFSLVVAVLALIGCAREALPPDLILVTVDTLRADHMSLYGYSRETTPNIDRFFAQGRVYERAYASSSYTPPSVFSILTGLWPFHHGLRKFMRMAPDSLETLATRLSAAGYECGAFVSNYVLRDEKTGLARGFATYDDSLPEKEAYRDTYERSAVPTTVAALAWLAERSDSEIPYFLWVHYIDPHGPYSPPEPKVREFSHQNPEPMNLDDIPKYQRHPGVEDALEYVDLYDEEIAHVDDSIGRLLRTVASLHRDRPWMVALSSDHGEALLERKQRFEHAIHVYEELIRVPLALRGEGIEPSRVAEPVSIVDIAPTLLAAAGLPIPEEFDGVPLGSTTPRHTVYSEAYPASDDWASQLWRTAIRGDEKWLLAPAARDVVNPFRSDFARIPETLTMFLSDEPTPDALAQLRAWHQEDWDLRRAEVDGTVKQSESPRRSKLNNADRDALRALGYLE